MMRRIILGLFLSVLASSAFGQGSVVVGSCPESTTLYTAGQTGRVPAIDIHGTVCTSASGGGGGGAVTNAGTFAVQNTVGPYPVGATAITASATGTAAATTATLAGTSGKTTYICSLSVRANATANANVTNTVTGVITGALSRAMWVPANTAGLGVDEQIYSPCIPASATNTAIAVVSGAPGTGGVVTVNATGYQL